MKKQIMQLLVVLGVGASIGGLYILFTTVVEKVQEIIWFDIVNPETNKWFVVLIALLSGIVLSAVLNVFKQKGHQDAGHTIPDLIAFNQVSLQWVVRGLTIGFVSLVAGASLGPEAILLPVSYGIGFLVGKSFGAPKPHIIGLFAVIALLAAFFNSPAAALVPLGFAVMAKTKNKKEIITALVLGLLASIASIGVLRAFDHKEGYVTLPDIGSLAMTPKLFAIAVIVAAGATLLPFLLNNIIPIVKKAFSKLPSHWILQGIAAGLLLGLLYGLLGPVSYFSGHQGLTELLVNNRDYTSLQLIALALGKIALTVWSIATIYRGGLVFPQLFIAMSLALLFSGADPNSSWLLTLLVASFFGVFVGSLGSLFIAAAFVLSLFGFAIWPLALAAAAGSFVVKLLLKKYFASANAA